MRSRARGRPVPPPVRFLVARGALVALKEEPIEVARTEYAVLEHKWLLSERAGRDVGLELAIAAYLDVGAPAPEAPDADEPLDAAPGTEGTDSPDTEPPLD